MRTYSRVCIKDYTITAKDGKEAGIKRGKEYLTSENLSGEVVVFQNTWVKFPVNCFAGEVLFTAK